MRNIDFSDIHKFIVSIGLALIFFAILVPWLFFREKFDLLLNKDDLNKLTDVAQNLITYRQEILLTTVRILPFLSGGLFLIGVVFVAYGLIKWNKKQKVVDEHQEVLLSKTKKEIETMSLGEKVKSVIKETEEEVETNTNNVSSNLQNNYDLYKKQQAVVSKYMEVEAKIFEKVTHSYSKYYEIKPNMRIGTQEFDIIMSSNSKEDVILEIKYFRKINSILKLNNTIDQLNNLLINYSSYIKKKATAKIIIVLPTLQYDEVTKNGDFMKSLKKFNFEIVLLNEELLNDLNGDFLNLIS